MTSKFLYTIFILLFVSICNGQIATTYDGHGRITSITYPDSSAIVYSYDAVGNRIYTLVQPPCSQTVTPAVTIAASPAGPVCQQTHVTFTANPVNGGPFPTYQWMKNGDFVGGNSSSYIDSTLNNNDSIWVMITSDAACAKPLVVSSDTIVMSINAQTTPSVNISASSTSVCYGTQVTFTATVNNGGTNPVYQWKVNGVNAGNNSTYSSSTLTNGAKVYCLVTGSGTCVSTTPVSSDSIRETVITYIPSISITASQTIFCGSTDSIIFTATTTNGGISPGYQWVKNGSNVGTNSPSYIDRTPPVNDSVWVILTSNESCVNPTTATSSHIEITPSAVVVPTVSVSATADTICPGTSITFTATSVNGGTNPTYQWIKNGNNIPGSNGTTYTSNALNNNDSVWVVMQSNAACANPTIATSNKTRITVNPVTAPSVNVTATQTVICAGESVSFTATAVNGGTNPIYQWIKSGIDVGTNSPIYSTSAFNNNDSVWVVVTSNAICVNTTTATSSKIVITLSTHVPPSVTIVASDTSICAGQNVTFTAMPTIGGPNPTYQWVLNGTNVATGYSPVYNNSTLGNSDSIWVIMTSNSSCANTLTATSNKIGISVNSGIIPSVILAASQDTICAGINVVFTATPTNGGAAPSYQWVKNGIGVSSNHSNTYSSALLSNNDSVWVILTSNAACAYPSAATSNKIPVTVNSVLVPSVSQTNISSVCAAQSVTFTAVSVNGGTNPFYQWIKNGINVGGDSTTFSCNTLNNNDSVWVVVTSNATCVNPPVASSNKNRITVNPVVVPTVSIIGADSICSGSSTTFRAVINNGGIAPVYNWQVNGLNTNTNSNLFTSSALQNADNVVCILTSSATCAIPPIDTSNSIHVTVLSSVMPTASISIPDSTICAGSPVTFTANVSGQGLTPNYMWLVNGHYFVGANGSVFTTSSLVNNSVVQLNLMSSMVCANPQSVNSNSINITVNPLPPTPVITQRGDSLFSSASYGNQWLFNGSVLQGSNANLYVARQNGEYQVVTTDINGCSSDTSYVYYYSTGIGNLNSLNINVYPNPVSNILFVKCTGSVIDDIRIVDMLGQTISNMKVGRSEYEINVSGLSGGSYLLLTRSGSVIDKHIINVVK